MSTRQAKFTVTLNRASDQSVSVDYATVAGSAVEAEDFTAQTGTVTFAPGETSKDVLIDLRATEEPLSEQFTLHLFNPVHAALATIDGVCTIPGVPPPGATVLLQDTFTGNSVPLALHLPDVGAPWYVQNLTPAPAPAPPPLLLAARTYSTGVTPAPPPVNPGLELLNNSLQVVSGGNPAHFKGVSTQGFGVQPDLVCEFSFQIPANIGSANVDTEVSLLNEDGHGMAFYYRHDANQNQEEFRVFVWGQGIGTVVIAQDQSWNAPQFLPFVDNQVVKITLTLQHNNYQIFINDSPSASGFYQGSIGDIDVPANAHVAVETNVYDGVSNAIELLNITVKTLTGTAVTGDGFGDAFLDTFTDAAGTNILAHTPEVGGAWTVQQLDGPNVVQTDGNNADGGVYLTNLNGSVGIATPYLGQRGFYVVEFDFVLSELSQPSDSYDLYAYLTDGEYYTALKMDFYQSGTSLDLEIYTFGTNVGSANLSSNPFNGLHIGGVKNTVRIEVYPDHWRVLVNGVEVIVAAEALGLVDPRLEFELFNYGASVPPYTINRVRVADTPVLNPTVLFAGNIAYTNPLVNAADDFTGVPAGQLSARLPNSGSQVEVMLGNPQLDGSGYLNCLASTWQFYVGQTMQALDYQLDWTLHIGALPSTGHAATVYTEGVREVSVTLDSTGTLSWMVQNVANAPGSSVALQATVGIDYAFSLLETTRVVQLSVNGSVVMTYERPRNGQASPAGVKKWIQLQNDDAFATLQLKSYALTEYLDQPQVFEESLQMLDHFQGNAGDLLETHPMDTGQAWTQQTLSGTAQAVLVQGGGVWPSSLPGEVELDAPAVSVVAPSWALDIDVLRLPDYGNGISGGFGIALHADNSVVVGFSLSEDNGVFTGTLVSDMGVVPVTVPILTPGSCRVRLATLAGEARLYFNGTQTASVAMSGYLYNPVPSVQVFSNLTDQAYVVERMKLVSNPSPLEGVAAPIYTNPPQFVNPPPPPAQVLFYDAFNGSGLLTAHTPDTGAGWQELNMPNGTHWVLDGSGNLQLNPQSSYGDAATSVVGAYPTLAAEIGLMFASGNSDFQFDAIVEDDQGNYYDVQFYYSIGSLGCKVATNSAGFHEVATEPQVPATGVVSYPLRIEISPTQWVVKFNGATLTTEPAGATLGANTRLRLANFTDYATVAANRTVVTDVTLSAPAGETPTPAPTGNTVLLLRGSDGLVDQSTHAHPLDTSAGGVAAVAVTGGIDGHALSFAYGYLGVGAPLSDFTLDGDFTFEFFAKKQGNGPAGYDIVASTYTAQNASDGWWLELSNTRGFYFGGATVSGGGGTSRNYLQYATNPNDDALHHWALERNGDALTMYKDGTAVASASGWAGYVFPAARMWLGSDFYNEYYAGYLDQIRLTKGMAVYKGNFSAPTGALTAL